MPPWPEDAGTLSLALLQNKFKPESIESTCPIYANKMCSLDSQICFFSWRTLPSSKRNHRWACVCVEGGGINNLLENLIHLNKQFRTFVSMDPDSSLKSQKWEVGAGLGIWAAKE